jgi:hypothetical protein
MKYLSSKAARLYLEVSKWSFFLEQIGWTQLVDRLQALSVLCSPSDPALLHAERVLRLSGVEQPFDSNWSLGNEEDAHSDVSHEPSFFESDVADDEFPYLYLIVGSHTGLASWKFHLYDPDWFPAVPHGHEKNGGPRKLDPYLGWVYKGTAQVRREDRWKIIALWNDDQFRKAARRSINYYMEHHPYFRGWRVDNPRKLPRKR